jgi:hypothetical protein
MTDLDRVAVLPEGREVLVGFNMGTFCSSFPRYLSCLAGSKVVKAAPRERGWPGYTVVANKPVIDSGFYVFARVCGARGTGRLGAPEVLAEYEWISDRQFEWEFGNAAV